MPLQGQPAMQKPLQAAATSQGRYGLSKAKGKRLETLPAPLGLIGLEQTTLLKGGHDLMRHTERVAVLELSTSTSDIISPRIAYSGLDPPFL